VATASGGLQASVTIQPGYKALWDEAQIRPALTTAQTRPQALLSGGKSALSAQADFA
jgi:hypothetical protein